jgi:hypothetical protein
VCIKDEPEVYNTSTGYIRAGDNVNAGAFGIGLLTFGAFGEITFGLVPEPSTYVLQFVALISIGVLRLKKG